MLTTELLHTLQVLFALFPYFFTVFLIAFLIQRGTKQLRNYRTFWLLSSILCAGLALLGLYEGKNGWAVINVLNAAGTSWATYMSREKNSPRVKKLKAR